MTLIFQVLSLYEISGFEVFFLSDFFFEIFSDFKGRQALHTPPQVVSWEFKLKPHLTRFVWNYSSLNGVTPHGDIDLDVIGYEPKVNFFFKLCTSEMAHFVDIVSGIKKHIHDIFLFCLFRAVEGFKGDFLSKKKS